jgi:hypothetical protein
MNIERENLLNVLKENILKCTGKEIDISEEDTFEDIGFPIYRNIIDIVNILSEFEINLNLFTIDNYFYYEVATSNKTFRDLFDYIMAIKYGTLLSFLQEVRQ